jgi:hypothetical protein
LLGTSEKRVLMRSWADLSEEEKIVIDMEMCEASQENMVIYYKAEIKVALSGKSIPKHVSKTLCENGIMVRIGVSGSSRLRFKIDQNILKKYRGLIE